MLYTFVSACTKARHEVTVFATWLGGLILILLAGTFICFAETYVEYNNWYDELVLCISAKS